MNLTDPVRDDLSELLERLEFCRSRSRELEEKIAQFAATSISHWLFPWPGQPGVGQIRAKLLSHPPVSLRQEVGMIVNEQRSILDALACRLATRNGANNINDVYFPITKTKEGFLENNSQRKMRKLGVDDQKAIKDLKPWFPAENDPEDGHLALFLLHEADRVRKNQDLLRWACLGGVHPVGRGDIGHLQCGQIVFREVGKEENLAFFAGVTCQLAVKFDLVYRESGHLEGRAVAPLLSAFNDSVEKIVTAFA